MTIPASRRTVAPFMAHGQEHWKWRCAKPEGCGYSSPFAAHSEEEATTYYNEHVAECRALQTDR